MKSEQKLPKFLDNLISQNDERPAFIRYEIVPRWSMHQHPVQSDAIAAFQADHWIPFGGLQSVNGMLRDACISWNSHDHVTPRRMICLRITCLRMIAHFWRFAKNNYFGYFELSFITHESSLNLPMASRWMTFTKGPKNIFAKSFWLKCHSGNEAIRERSFQPSSMAGTV